MPMGFPSWTSFLTTLAAQCGKTVRVAELLANDEYEEAAEVVEAGLSKEIFSDRVTHTFGKRRSQSCTVSGPVLALPDLCSGAVITTNFDRILERVFLEAGSQFTQTVWGAHVDSVRNALADGKPYLIKIHGDAEERSGRVLTRSEFDSHYAKGNPNNLRAQLGLLFRERTLLFLGCSLANDRPMEVLFEALQQAAGLKHFALLELPEDSATLSGRTHWLGERAIRPIWFPTKRYDLIEPALRWLALQQHNELRIVDTNLNHGGQIAGSTKMHLPSADPISTNQGNHERKLRQRKKAGEEATDATPNVLSGSKSIQVHISQHFTIADVLIHPLSIRSHSLAEVVGDVKKMRRVLNNRKGYKVGDIGSLRPVATIADKSNDFFSESMPDFRVASAQQLWFLPFELSLTEYFCKDRYDAHSMLSEMLGDAKTSVVNKQVSCRLRVYPPGVGVIRLSITLTFKHFVLVDVVSRIAQDLEEAFFVDPIGEQKPFVNVLVQVIDQVADSLFLEQKTSGSDRRWRPPGTSYCVRDDFGFVLPKNVRALAQLMSLVPENTEEIESLEFRINRAIESTHWRRDRLIALPGERVALLHAEKGVTEAGRKRQEKMIRALLETEEVISAGAYSERALLNELNAIYLKRLMDDDWPPEKGTKEVFLSRLLKVLKLVLQAIASFRLDLDKHGKSVLREFAAEIWRHNHSTTSEDLKRGLEYVRAWSCRCKHEQPDQIYEEIVRSINEIELLSEPFR